MREKDDLEQDAIEFFHTCFHQEYERLVCYAAAVLKGRGGGGTARDKAEEAVQDMFLLAWQRREEVLRSKKPVGWLYNALYYKILELLREEKRWSDRLLRYEACCIPPEDSLLSVDTELEGAVPNEDFQLLSRVYREGYSYQEICDELHISKQALAARIHRIKKKLRKALEET